MNSKLFFVISLGIFAGGAALYLFIRRHEETLAEERELQSLPKGEIGFSAILNARKAAGPAA